jgi:hypothetical protein
VLIAIYCTVALDGNASLADVSFQVANVAYGTATDLGLPVARLNEGCPAVTAVPGRFTVRGPEICDGQDNDGNGLTDEICTVSGTVLYYLDGSLAEPSAKPVPYVGIDARGDTTPEATTNSSGAYTVGGLYGNVTVTTLAKFGSPRASDHNGAISSLDASAVARAAVGAETLSSHRRVAVGLVDHFPVAVTAGSDWKFEKCDPVYPDDCGAPSYSFNPFTTAQTGKNFYALLYGEVTGNWQPGGGGLLLSEPVSGEEVAAMARDRSFAEQLRLESRRAPVDRPTNAGPAELTLLGWKPLKAGERRQLTIDLRNAEGILGLDLKLEYEPSRLSIVGVETAGIGTALNLARSDEAGEHRIAAYGVEPLTGSGSVLTVTVEALKNTGGNDAPSIGGMANEGAISLRVRGRSEVPSRER